MTEKGFMTADMHSHSHHSIDGKYAPDAICEAAYRLGLGIVNISDHCDVNRDADTHCYETITASVADALRLKREYDGKLKVLAGIELGNGHWKPDLAKKCAGIEGIDCITGSVHRIVCDGETLIPTTADFNSMTHEHILRLVRKYFEDIHLMLDVVRPDILAHMSYLLRYIVGYHHIEVELDQFTDCIDELLKRVIREGIALELNTQIMTEQIADYDRVIFERYHALGGRLCTLGSDAHIPTRLANGFEAASAALKQLGFNEACYIENREIHSYKL